MLAVVPAIAKLMPDKRRETPPSWCMLIPLVRAPHPVHYPGHVNGFVHAPNGDRDPKVSAVDSFRGSFSWIPGVIRIPPFSQLPGYVVRPIAEVAGGRLPRT